jgi:methylamine utilization protein MauE
MPMVERVLSIATALAVAMLLDAGLYKLADPHQLRRALHELWPGFADAGGDGVVRLAAGIEVAAAILIVVPATLVPGAWVAAALGMVFAALGAVGMARGSSVPCGCLGHDSRQALGPGNVLIGLSLAAVMLLAAGSRPAVSPLVVALFALVICLWINRRLAVRLLGKGTT